MAEQFPLIAKQRCVPSNAARVQEPSNTGTSCERVYGSWVGCIKTFVLVRKFRQMTIDFAYN